MIKCIKLFLVLFFSIFLISNVFSVSPQFYGNEFLMTASVSCSLNNSNFTKWAGIFTAKNSKQVNRISVNIGVESGISPSYNYGIQSLDASGNPSGAWVTRNTFQATLAGWTSIDVPSAYNGSDANLVAGTKYAVVVDYNSGLPWDPSNFISIRHANDNIDIVPFDNTLDLNYDTQCQNTASSWVSQARDPIFLVCYTDGNCEGQPYSLGPLDEFISNNDTNAYGEKFIAKETLDYNSVGIYVRCSLASPKPNGDLNIVLSNLTDNTTDFNAVIYNKNDCITAYSWKTAIFSPSKTLTAGKTYVLWVKSPDSNSTSRYVMQNLRNNNDANSNKANWQGTDSNQVWTTGNADNPLWQDGGTNIDVRGFRFERYAVFIPPSTLTAQVVFPNGGESLSGESTLQWNAFSQASTQPLTASLYYDADNNPGNGMTLIVKDLNLFAPPSGSWGGCSSTDFTLNPTCYFALDTHNIFNGSYYLYVELNDGSNIAFDYSDAPFSILNLTPGKPDNPDVIKFTDFFIQPVSGHLDQNFYFSAIVENVNEKCALQEPKIDFGFFLYDENGSFIQGGYDFNNIPIAFGEQKVFGQNLSPNTIPLIEGKNYYVTAKARVSSIGSCPEEKLVSNNEYSRFFSLLLPERSVAVLPELDLKILPLLLLLFLFFLLKK
ncbi:MAG: hypothetical protein AB1467_04615 [Candidatus Diapherotrites archaeon]